MELDHGHRLSKLVCIYEMTGTALLVYAVNVSNGDPFAIAFTLFTCILITGPVSGGHCNPAVTTGVFMSEKKWKKHYLLYLEIMAAQFIGGIIGVIMAFVCLTNGNFTKDYDQGSIPIDELVIIRPRVADIRAFTLEVICTAVFVMVILVVKTARVAPTQ